MSYSSTFWIGIFRWLYCLIQVLFNGLFPFQNAHLLWFFYPFHFRCESRAVKTLEWSESNGGEQHPDYYTLGNWLNPPDSTPMGWTHSKAEWPVQYIKGKPGGSWFGCWDTESIGQSDQFCHLAPLLLPFSGPDWRLDLNPHFFKNYVFVFFCFLPATIFATVLLWPFFLCQRTGPAEPILPTARFLLSLLCFLFYGGWKVHPIWFLLSARLWWWWWWWWCQK